MGAVRDFLRGVGILSSAGITVSNAGTRLLNLRNDLNKLASKGAPANEKPIVEERLVGYGREAMAAVSKRAPARAATSSESVLEHKRIYNRERMRRLRARKKQIRRKMAKK